MLFTFWFIILANVKVPFWTRVQFKLEQLNFISNICNFSRAIKTLKMWGGESALKHTSFVKLTFLKSIAEYLENQSQIQRFHLRGQRPYWFTKQKKRFNSRSFGLVHQYGHRDIIRKRSISSGSYCDVPFQCSELIFALQLD